MAAFVFAAQMINFTIPGTGASGHLGGGMLLAALLGPYAGFLAMSSILLIQAFFFADGGLLALGANIFNLGFFPCFVVYPLFKKILEQGSRKRIASASFLGAILSLQLGAFFVVLQTYFSGISALPFTSFLMMMLPIHLAIGFVEGFVTMGVLLFLWQAKPEYFSEQKRQKINFKKALCVIVPLTLITGGIFAWYASENPDGLEWSIHKVSGKEELPTSHEVHKKLEKFQEKTSMMPDYDFKKSQETEKKIINPGTSLAGIIGSFFTLAIIVLFGFSLKRIGKRQNVSR